MASSSNNLAQPQIPILKEKNYEIWSMKMKSLLEYEGVWDVVVADSITTQENRKDKRALYLIRYGLDDGLDDIVLRQISAAESSKKAWDILETNYKKNTNESRINNNAVVPNLPVILFVAISAGFVVRLLFGDFPSGSDSGMQCCAVLIEVLAMVLLMYVIYKIAGLETKITTEELKAMAIGAVIGMIVGISGGLFGCCMSTGCAVDGSSISIYMILGAVLGAIYYDVIKKK